MAQPTTKETTTGPSIDEAFVADRQMFWGRFTSFTTGAVVVVALVLIAMRLFLM